MSRNDTDQAELSLCQQRVTMLEAELAQARSRLLTLRQESDLTEMDQVPQTHLQERTQLLSMIAQVANLLLRSPDYMAVLPDVVRLLGEAVGSDRCGIGQTILHPTSGEPAVRLLPEWCKTAVLASEKFSPHDDQLFLWQQDAPFIAQQLEQGNVVNCLVKDLPDPDRSLLAAQGNTAELFVPILINHHCWGFIAFDNCCETRLYDEAEVAILKIAADSIAAAIERQAKDVELRNVQENLLQTEQRRSAELAKANEALQWHEQDVQQSYRLLSVVAEVTKDLLENSQVEEAIAQAFQKIGEADQISRVVLMQERLEVSSGRLQHVVIQEWTASGIPRQMDDPATKAVYNDEYGVLANELEAGRSIWYVLEDLPEPAQSQQSNIAVKSTGAVPIFIEGKYFGCVAFDDCIQHREWTPQDIDVLTSAAGAIGAALHRKQLVDRLVAERIQAEQARSQELEHLNTELIHAIDRLQTRDRLLEVTAMAANALLTLDDFDEAMNTTLKIMGEALQTDRVKVLEHFFEDKSSVFPNYSAVTYEWVTPGTISQMTHPTSAQIDARDADMAFMRTVLYNGFGGLLHEWDRTLWDAFEAVQAKAIYCVPIRVHDRVWGSFIFDDCHEVKQRSPIEMAILKIGANCIGSAIERKRSQQHLLEVEQQRAAELAKTNRALKNSLDRLATSPDLDAFLGYILLEIVQQFNLDLANLYLYDPATETLSLKLQVQDQQVKLQPQSRVFDALLHCSTSNSPIWRILLETKRPLTCDRQNGQANLSPSTVGHQPNESAFQMEVHLLLTLGDEPIGLVSLGANQRAVLTLQELELAQSLTHQITLAIQLTHLAEEARQNSLLQERNRIAQDIHDTLAQAFGGILIQLQATQYFLNRSPEKAFEQFNVAIALAREGLAEARRSVWTLYNRSADYQSLEVALPQLVERLTQGNAVQTNVTIEGTPYRLDPEVGQNLLRLAQEALNNALRHAHAQIICLTLSYESDRLVLSVQDNGHGFDPNQPINGFGISNMKQRAEYLGSTLTLTSQPGVGTEVAIAISTVSSNAKSTNLADYLPPGGASKMQLPD